MLYYSPSSKGFYDDAIHGNMPDDKVPLTNEKYRYLLEGQATGRIICMDQEGKPSLSDVCPSPDHRWTGNAWVLDKAAQKKRLIDIIQLHMDSKAQAYGYDHILSASSYAQSSVDKWHSEGTAFKQWRDDVWACGLALLQAYEAGTNTINSEAELIAALPAFPLDE